MKNTSLSQRINLSFLLIVMVIVITGFIFYDRARSNESQLEMIENANIKGIDIAQDIRIAVSDHWQQVTALAIALRQDPANARSLLQQGEQSLLLAEQQLRELERQYEPTIILHEDRKLFQKLQQQLQAYLSISAELQAALNDSQADAYGMILKKRDGIDQLRDVLDELVQLNEQSYQQALEVLHTNISRNMYTAILLVICAVLIATLSGYLLRRAILKPIGAIVTGMNKMGDGMLSHRIEQQGGGEFAVIIAGFNEMAESLKELVIQTQGSAVHLSTSITELAATSKQQQATVTETAATTAEIGATSKQISATARELLHTVSEAADTAEQTAKLAQSSQESVNSMDDVMHQLSSAAEMVSGKLALLSERATGINQVVTTIMKVADQTNLLSLNAAIEAEKAGEYGKGFTVVANEIRRLADQTAIATYDIEQMVREIQSAVAAGVMGIDKFSEEVRRGSTDMNLVSEQLSLIIDQVQELAPHIQQVNEGMQHQSEGAEQINVALSQLADATSQTVESLVQTSSTIDNMNDVAGKLRHAVNRFRV